ncbi:MAG: acetate kinase [Firmicutes bacterium]|nr:acetate kinase [Bacillota bacterium]
MNILVLNSGSSSLKYQLFDMNTEQVMASGYIEKIGIPGSTITHKRPGIDKIFLEQDIADHGVAIETMVAALTSPEHGVIQSMKEIDAVGHRVVHGGTAFIKACLIDEQAINTLESLTEMAPLHNPAAVKGMRACQEKIPGVPMTVVVDTAFHQTMPRSSYMYGLPYEYYEKYQIRRYGCHGTSHRFVAQRCAELLGRQDCKIITCHLGNGSSLAAIKNGEVQDTSMGFTPLAGVVMGTRTGDFDPSLVPYIMEKENLTPAQMSDLINKKSGLLGLSGVGSDLRDVVEAAKNGNDRAKMALEVFVTTVVRFIGAYAAELNGVDAIVFTAGIGENSVPMRRAICQHLSYLGADFDEEANECAGEEKEISKPGSKTKIYIIPTNEELLIARDTKELVESLKK